MYYVIFFAVILLAAVYSYFAKTTVKLSDTKNLCVLALLVAITVLLAVYATIRIGTEIKISFKFISIFITAAFFGPLWGGAVAAIADITAFFINPVGGVLLLQITMVEFLHGFIYGLFFYKLSSWKSRSAFARISVCTLIQTLLLTLCLTTFFLVPLMKLSFNILLIKRLPSVLVSMAVQLGVLMFLAKYMPSLKKALR